MARASASSAAAAAAPWWRVLGIRNFFSDGLMILVRASVTKCVERGEFLVSQVKFVTDLEVDM